MLDKEHGHAWLAMCVCVCEIALQLLCGIVMVVMHVAHTVARASSNSTVNEIQTV